MTEQEYLSAIQDLGMKSVNPGLNDWHFTMDWAAGIALESGKRHGRFSVFLDEDGVEAAVGLYGGSDYDKGIAIMKAILSIRNDIQVNQ